MKSRGEDLNRVFCWIDEKYHPREYSEGKIPKDEEDCEKCSAYIKSLESVTSPESIEEATSVIAKEKKKKCNLEEGKAQEDIYNNLELESIIKEANQKANQEVADNIEIFKLWYEYHKRYNPMKILLGIGSDVKKYGLPTPPFEDWLNQKRMALVSNMIDNKFQDKFKPKAVRRYSDIVKDEMETCIKMYAAQNNGKEPTLNEFIDLFNEFIKYNGGGLSSYINPSLYFGGRDVVLCIRIIDEDTKKLTSEFGKMITKLRKADEIKRKKIMGRDSTTPISSLGIPKKITDEEIKSLTRYLAVYDLNEKHKNKFSKRQIALQHYPDLREEYVKSKSDQIDYEKEYSRDLKKAIKILENVLNGIFPGEYSVS